MHGHRTTNHTGRITALIVAAGSLFLLTGATASDLAQTRGVIPLNTPDATSPAIALPDPETIDWDAYLLWLLEMMCIVIQCEDEGMTASQLTSSAADRVHIFINTFNTTGLKPYLTGDEIARGISTANNARSHILMGRGAPGTLGPALAAELDSTLVRIITALQQASSADNVSSVR